MGLPVPGAIDEYVVVREEEWREYCLEQIRAIPWGTEFLKLTFRKRPLRRCHDHRVWEEIYLQVSIERGRQLRLKSTG